MKYIPKYQWYLTIGVLLFLPYMVTGWLYYALVLAFGCWVGFSDIYVGGDHNG